KRRWGVGRAAAILKYFIIAAPVVVARNLFAIGAVERTRRWWIRKSYIGTVHCLRQRVEMMDPV
ncbi:MAG: hypothetical protein PUK74_01415, partial [Elusimicrobia bacterium]|nr:hypothetical protein [Elusimicrobiota bacterium]MDY5729753.1 hypothetical protein [Elusimicrobiaceae bacterium]